MNRSYLSFLSLVRAGSTLLLLASVTLIALGQFLWGVGVLVLALGLPIGLYRCPDCRQPLDERMPLKHLSVCPYCGCDLKNRAFSFWKGAKRKVKKCIPLLLVVLLLFSGCGRETSQGTQPTGYASGVHQPQVMYQGTLYYYQATGFDETIPPTFSLAGTVAQRSDLAPPQKDWCSGLVAVGASIYADENNPTFIYVEDSQGIAKFSSRE